MTDKNDIAFSRMIFDAIQRPECQESIGPEHLDSIYDAVEPVLKQELKGVIKKCIDYSIYKSKPNDMRMFRDAMESEIDMHLKKHLGVYLFKNMKWREGVPVVGYLAKTMYAINRECSEQELKSRKFVCPACREYRVWSILEQADDNMLICRTCLDAVKNDSNPVRTGFAACFAIHSRRGVECPVCSRFVPCSFLERNSCCPYPGCKGKVSVSCSTAKIHPATKSANIFVELDTGRNVPSVQSMCLDTMEEFECRFDKIKETIREQRKVNGATRSSPNKSVMYDAISSVLEKFPVEMVTYITRNGSSELPVQSFIFQEFSRMMLERLPATFRKRNASITVTDPTDERLNLFIDHFSFRARIGTDSCIKKPTILSRYAKYCTSKPCSGCRTAFACSFIGYITDVKDDSGKDMLKDVASYSFTNVRFLSGKAMPGGYATVGYYGIPAHYSVKSMAHMQRIIKRLHKSCMNRKI